MKKILENQLTNTRTCEAVTKNLKSTLKTFVNCIESYQTMYHRNHENILEHHKKLVSDHVAKIKHQNIYILIQFII